MRVMRLIVWGSLGEGSSIKRRVMNASVMYGQSHLCIESTQLPS